MAAGVAQVTAACCWRVRVSGVVTLLENVGFDTTADTGEVVLGSPPVALAATDTVIRTLSVAPAARVVVRVHDRVPTVQIQPPSVSVIAVAVRPAGRVTLSAVALLRASVSLVSVTATVTVSSVSPSMKTESLGLVVIAMETVGRTMGTTKLERSKSAYSSIFSCAISAVVKVGHSAGNIG